MPLPAPRDDESRDEFISRAMGNPSMVREYPDEKQRLAVAYSLWKKELRGRR